ncbi:MAG: zf-HC2 domain-containing protein [Ilumatobacteraceae bacterium]
MTREPTDSSCARWQDAISAMVDGEEPGVDSRLVAAHVARCAPCRAFESFAASDRRHTLVHEATPMPDLARRVTKWAAVLDRASRWSLVRAVLAMVALEIVAFSLPALILGDESNTSAHAARHLGAFTVAYGVGLLVVVIRPARARAMLPVAAVLAGALVITAVIDLADGQVPLLGETQHLPEVLSVALVWLLAVPSPRRTGHHRRRPGRPVLTVVEPPAREARDVG